MDFSRLPSGWEKRIVKEGDCYIWKGASYGNGYGTVRVDKAQKPVHCAVYELLVGPVPWGWLVHHRCKNIKCVNPDHLEAMSYSKHNGMKASSPVRTKCKRGHLLTDDNIVPWQKNRRRCLICKRARDREAYYSRKKRMWEDAD